MAYCQYEQLPDRRWKCPNCGDIAKPYAGPPVRNCEKPTYGPPVPGLGDHVASGLEALGITKEKFSAWLGKPCNCAATQEKLNRAGRYLKMRLAKLGTSAQHSLQT